MAVTACSPASSTSGRRSESQQPGAGLGVARAPLGDVAADPPGGFEHAVVDDRRRRDLDPFGAGSSDLAVWAPGPGVGGGLGLVPVGQPDVGLVAQKPSDRRGSPHRPFAGRGRHAVGVEPPGDLASRVSAGDVVSRRWTPARTDVSRHRIASCFHERKGDRNQPVDSQSQPSRTVGPNGVEMSRP